MPVTPPTYSGAYSEAEQEANAATICGFIDTANTALATAKAGNLAALDALREVVLRLVGDNQSGQARSTMIANIDAAVTANGG